MKVFERLPVFNNIKRVICAAEDNLQFVYKTAVGADDAIIYPLHKALSHSGLGLHNYINITCEDAVLWTGVRLTILG